MERMLRVHRLVLPFWYWPTQVVPDKAPLNGCVCVCVERVLEHQIANLGSHYIRTFKADDVPTKRANLSAVSGKLLVWKQIVSKLGTNDRHLIACIEARGHPYPFYFTTGIFGDLVKLTSLYHSDNNSVFHSLH